MSTFQLGFLQGRAFEELEHTRRMELNRPVTSVNPPELMALVDVIVVRPFFVHGRRVESGQTVKLSRFDARSLAAIGKVQLPSR